MDNVSSLRPTLPVESALRVVGGKWKVLIIWHLKDGVRRYGALRRLIPNVTQMGASASDAA
jgi:DNA-binding HxlR family transcriptional regulator